MSSDLSQLAVWIKDSKMLLHISKCSVLWFRSLPFSPPDTCIDGAPLQIVGNQKYFGVIFDNGQNMFQLSAKKVYFG